MVVALVSPVVRCFNSLAEPLLVDSGGGEADSREQHFILSNSKIKVSYTRKNDMEVFDVLRFGYPTKFSFAVMGNAVDPDSYLDEENPRAAMSADEISLIPRLVEIVRSSVRAYLA